LKIINSSTKTNELCDSRQSGQRKSELTSDDSAQIPEVTPDDSAQVPEVTADESAKVPEVTTHDSAGKHVH